VVNAIINHIELNNATAIQSRSENFKGKFDFIVSRAVTNLPDFIIQTRHLISPHSINALPNGILYLKGGDISEEITTYKKKAFISELNQCFQEAFFETKKLIHLPL
jgi:16S rRNA (guanine527-N7)-methyltransferase